MCGPFEYQLARQGRIQSVSIAIEDRPDFLARIAALISAAGGNILDVLHDRLSSELSAKAATLVSTFEARDVAHVRRGTLSVQHGVKDFMVSLQAIIEEVHLERQCVLDVSGFREEVPFIAVTPPYHLLSEQPERIVLSHR